MSDTGAQSGEGVSRRFDPRFSPAFQPGYDPRVHRETPPSAPLRDEPVRDWPESRRDAQIAGHEQSEVDDDLSIFAIPEVRVSAPDEESVAEEEPVQWWSRVNPWFVALWVIGVVFLLAGAGGINYIVEWAGSPQQQTGFDYASSILMQAVLWVASLLIALGLATLTSTVVIMAARRRR